jgi:peroxiredoxin
MRRIFLVIPISAALIAGLVVFKLNRRYEPVIEEPVIEVRPAPDFKLYDQHSQIVRLERYIGRDHKLLIAFFDGRQGPERSSLLSLLRERNSDFQRAGGVVVAISALRPSEIRYGIGLGHLHGTPADGAPSAASEIQYPFPVLSDIVDYEVHKRYGAFDEKAQVPIEAVFVVDRAGWIQYAHYGPGGLGGVEDWLRELREVR